MPEDQMIEEVFATHGKIVTAQQAELIPTCTAVDPHSHCAACGDTTERGRSFCDACE